MHRSYRENSPIQIIRYDNRIEIINPGFSLKPEEMWVNPVLKLEINLLPLFFMKPIWQKQKVRVSELCGSLMQRSHLAPPTFESNREGQSFCNETITAPLP